MFATSSIVAKRCSSELGRCRLTKIARHGLDVGLFLRGHLLQKRLDPFRARGALRMSLASAPCADAARNNAAWRHAMARVHGVAGKRVEACSVMHCSQKRIMQSSP